MSLRRLVDKFPLLKRVWVNPDSVSSIDPTLRRVSPGSSIPAEVLNSYQEGQGPVAKSDFHYWERDSVGKRTAQDDAIEKQKAEAAALAMDAETDEERVAALQKAEAGHADFEFRAHVYIDEWKPNWLDLKSSEMPPMDELLGKTTAYKMKDVPISEMYRDA